jgi:hypothetical protein
LVAVAAVVTAHNQTLVQVQTEVILFLLHQQIHFMFML